MKSIWHIEETYPTIMIMDNGIIEERKGWLLKCPEGHLLRATSNFENLADPFQLGCPTCKKLFYITLKNS